MKRRFIDIFEIDENSGSFLYLTTACCERHKDLSREEQELPEETNRETVGNYGNLEWTIEQFNLNCAHQLKQNFDIDPKGDLDTFVSNYKHLLSNDMVERKEIFERIKSRDV